MIPLYEEEKHDYYGELLIFFFIYPYRFFVASSIVLWALFGAQYAYPLLFIWLLAFIDYLAGCIYANSPKWRDYSERERLRIVARNKMKQWAEYQRLVGLHKNDPPKPVTKRF